MAEISYLQWSIHNTFNYHESNKKKKREKEEKKKKKKKVILNRMSSWGVRFSEK